MTTASITAKVLAEIYTKSVHWLNSGDDRVSMNIIVDKFTKALEDKEGVEPEEFHEMIRQAFSQTEHGKRNLWRLKFYELPNDNKDKNETVGQFMRELAKK